jgi:hypothetical protein
VKTENLVLNQSGKRKIVEEIGEVLPDVRISVFTQAFVVKSVDLCDLTGFVVSTKDCDALRVTDFQSNKECDGLNRVVPTVNIVTWFQSALPTEKREMSQFSDMTDP